MRARVRVWRWGIGSLATAVAFAIAIGLGAIGVYNLAYAVDSVDALLQGFAVTLQIVAIVIPVGFGLGLIVGSLRTSPRWLARALGTAYVEFFRGMPPLVLIVFGALSAGLIFRRYLFIEDPFVISLAVGIMALAFHSGGYQGEIIRAGIQSVPRGQVEAAYAIGLTPWQAIGSVILPQAFRVSLPALGNEFASVIKDTSLISAISALELSLTASLVARQALPDLGLVIVVWLEAALLYLVLTFAVTRIVLAVENRVKVPGLEAAQL